MPSVTIDGNDVDVVYDTAIDAVGNARRGEGPAFIECMTYRWRGHVGPKYDLDRNIRTQKELKQWGDRCPIKHIEKELADAGRLPPELKEQIGSDLRKEVEETLDYAKKQKGPAPETLLRNIYVE